jgi:hypothetical protein
MSGERRLTHRGAKNLGERERAAGLDPDDEAARWLQEHDRGPERPTASKSARKSKLLHQWRRRQERTDG